MKDKGSKNKFHDYKELAKKRNELMTREKFKLMPGNNTLRVLRTPEGRHSTPVLMMFAVHNDVGPEKRWLRCGIDPVTGKGKCWICNKLIPQLEKKGKESRAAKLAPETKTVVTVASISESGTWRGPFIWYPSGKKADELCSSILGASKRDYVDHKRGYNLNIHRTGTGIRDTRYGPIEPDDAPSKVPSSIVEKLVPFDENKEIPKYDEARQKKAYYGEDYDDDRDSRDDDDEDEDDDRKKKKGRSREDDEDEDDEDEDEDDEDEDEDEDENDEDEDDEDEDEDEDDEDGDEKKKKSSKKKKSRR